MYRFTLNNDIEGAYVCPSDPGGWDTGELSLIRSPKYHGVNYSRSLSLQFYCNAGKEYIDNIYNTQGIDAEITILVEDSCDCIPIQNGGDYNNDYNDDYNTGSPIYNCDFLEFYSGILNLKEYKETEQFTDVPIIEQSLNQKFNSRNETKVNLFGTDTVDGETFTNIDTQSPITLHSKALTYVANFEILNATDEKPFPDATDTLYMEIPIFEESSEGFTFLQNPQTPFIHDNDGTAAGNFEGIWRNETGQDQTISLDIDVEGGIKVAANGNVVTSATRSTSLQIRIGLGFDGATITTIKAPFNHTYFNTFTTVPLDSTLTGSYLVPAGHTLYVAFVISNIPSDLVLGNPWLVETDFTKFNLNMTNVNTTSSSEAVGTLVYEAFSRVLQGILSVQDPLRSEYYGRINASPYEEPQNGDGSFTMVMDGFRIRQYPITGEFARTPSFSFNELYNTFDSIDDIGFGFELNGGTYKARIERKPYFYSNNKSLTLLKVPDVKISVAQEWYFNNIEIGFQTWQSNGINGLDEYCASSQYTNGLKSISNKLDKLSPGIASAYLLETIRRQPFSNTITTDTDYDNNLFIVALNRSVNESGIPSNLSTAEKNENFSSIQNVLDPSTIYNLRFASVRNLIRNIPTISSSLVKNIGRFIKFTSGKGNYKTITAESSNTVGDYNNQNLNGAVDIQWDGTNVIETPLVIPEYIEFEYPLTKSEFNTLQNNPYDYIEVNTGRNIHYGYIVDVKFKPLSGLTKFKLIRKWQ